ncbi:MAG TPA: serine hydrolase domain-containing protein [Telluria sp.]|jgi:CubicO group peptidase (beta-lactamase class C family)
MTHFHGWRLSLAAASIALLLAACGGGGGGDHAPAPAPQSLPVISRSPAGSTQATDAVVDAYVQAQLVEGKIPGASIAVMDNGRLIYAKSYGYARLEGAEPMTPEHRLEIGSISKTFTAAAVMLMVEEGRIDLDAKISTYIGPVLPSWEGITVRHLLNHTSGLPENPDAGPRDRLQNHVASEAEFLEVYMKVPATGKPGQTWSYSNIGFDLLGLIMGRITGRFYGDYVKEKIFVPLGMDHTRIMSATDDGTGKAMGYTMNDRQQIVALRHPAGVVRFLSMAASGIESTALDIAKYDAALRGDTLLRQSSRDAMWTVSALAEARTGDMRADVNYGLGWFLSTVDTYRKIYHSGGMPAFTSDFIRYQDAGMSVIVLTNQSYDRKVPQVMSRGIAKIYRPELPR